MDTGVYIRIGEDNDSIYNMSSKKGNRSDVHKDLFDINKLSELKNYPTSLWKMKSNDFEDLFKHGWEATNATLKFNSPSIMKKNN